MIKELGGGLDTVSLPEILLGIEAGFDPTDIIFTPNGVSLEEIENCPCLAFLFLPNLDD